MTLRRLRITGLRCLTEVEIDLDPRCNYIFGPNGAGKTSLLEAIHLLGRGRSFRTRQTRRLVQRGRDGLAVYGEVDREGQSWRLGVGVESGRVEKKVNGRPAESMVELARLLPVFVVDPSLHRLIEGGPSERRRYLDWGVFHVEHRYLAAWRRYRRTLGQRNTALKRQCGREELQAWDRALVEEGRIVDALRARYSEHLATRVEAIGATLLGRPVKMEYERGWPAELGLADAMARSSSRDRASGNTEVGPHRGDLTIRIAAVEAKDDASRGQQKLVTAALVLAQVELYAERARDRPVLLVDDPAAELDQDGLARLLGIVGDLDVQLVLTGLTPGAVTPAKGCPVFHVEQGTVRSMV